MRVLTREIARIIHFRVNRMIVDGGRYHSFLQISASIVLSRRRASEGLYPAIGTISGMTARMRLIDALRGQCCAVVIGCSILIFYTPKSMCK